VRQNSARMSSTEPGDM